MKLSVKAPLLVAFAAAVIFLSTGYTCSRAQLEFMEKVRRARLVSVADAVKSGLEGSGRGAAAQADFFANLGSIREAVREHDIAGIESVLKPQWAALSVKNAVEQIYVFDKDLKLIWDAKGHHKPGDDMSYRDTAVRAHRYRETQSGLELGSTGYAVRAVACVESGTELYGSIQWGSPLGRMLERAKSTTGTELSLFLDERIAASSGRPDVTSDAGSGYRTVASTNADLVKTVLTNEFLSSVTEQVFTSITVHGVEYDVLALPVFDFAGRQVGVAGGVRPMTEMKQELAATMAYFLVGTGIGVVLLAGVVVLVYTHFLKKPLEILAESLERFTKQGDYSSPIAHKGVPNEFGGASKSLNKLREKLFEEQKLTEEAELIVTTRHMRASAAEATIEPDEAKDKKAP
jgi:hypothetical protein